MTCSGNPKTDHLVCQWTLRRWCFQNFYSMVHREANRFKSLVLCGAPWNKTDGALRNKECTPKQETVHCEANFGALQSKKWCTAKQGLVHC